MHRRNKGARGEREWAEFLRHRMGCKDARRGQQFSGSPDSPDVVGGIPGTHPEVKRTERLSLYAAMRQAIDDCGESVPYVAHRRNREDWLVVIRAEAVEEFSRRGGESLDED